MWTEEPRIHADASWHLRKIAPLVACYVAAFLATTLVEAQIVINVPSDRPTIQAAIDFANNGDTVLVAPGTYHETINFRGKAITVASTDGPEVTIIDGNQADSVVTFASGEGPASVVSGFTIRNGRSSFVTPGFGEGGGIRIGGSSPTVMGNIITSNQACDGNGIAAGFGSPLIQGNVISNNTRCCCSGGNGGGGILVRGSSTVEIVDNIISNNSTTADGGGISLFAAGAPRISGNIISGNIGGQGAGIALANFSDALIVQNLITSNRGAGISWLVPFGARGPLLVNNTIADNESSGIVADGFDTQTQLINNIVAAKAGQSAVLCGLFFGTAQPIFKFNDVFSPSGTGYGGVCTDQTGMSGNISADPLFVDPANADYHLQPSSPAIDAGDNTAPDLPVTDLDGNPRIVDGTGTGEAVIDMGVYEFTPAVAPSGPRGHRGHHERPQF